MYWRQRQGYVCTGCNFKMIIAPVGTKNVRCPSCRNPMEEMGEPFYETVDDIRRMCA